MGRHIQTYGGARTHAQAREPPHAAVTVQGGAAATLLQPLRCLLVCCWDWEMQRFPFIYNETPCSRAAEAFATGSDKKLWVT